MLRSNKQIKAKDKQGMGIAVSPRNQSEGKLYFFNYIYFQQYSLTELLGFDPKGGNNFDVTALVAGLQGALCPGRRSKLGGIPGVNRGWLKLDLPAGLRILDPKSWRYSWGQHRVIVIVPKF